MMTRQALDLPWPICPPATKLLPTIGDHDGVATRGNADGYAFEHVGGAFVEQRVFGGGFGQGTTVGDPDVEVAGGPGADFLGVAGPGFDFGAVEVAGEGGALVAHHFGGDAEGEPDDDVVAAAFPDGREADGWDPAGLERAFELGDP